MNTKIIKLDINKKMFETITAKQGDTKSRFILFNLYDGPIQFDLTGRTVRVYGEKKDNTTIFNDLVITDAKKGYCTLELTNQMLAVEGMSELELVIFEGEKRLSTMPFILNVVGSKYSEDAIASTNEFTALSNALKTVGEIDNKADKKEVEKISSQLDTKANKNDIVDWINLNSIITNLEDISTDVKNAIEGLEGATLYIPFGNYRFNPFKISNTDNLTIVCDGKLFLNNIDNVFAIQFENCSNLTLEMLNCEFNNSNVVGIVLTDCKNYKINGGNLANIGKNEATYSCSGMLIRGRSHNGRIRDIMINSVKSSTFGSGIHLDKYSDTLPCNTVIDGVLIQDIAPITDGDGIKILNGIDEDCNLVVSNSTFIDCRKRALKFQAKGCKSIGNTMIWNERGYVPIEFQRGYGKSIGDTIITNWNGDSEDIQNGYFRALASISNGYVDISDLTYKINTNTAWLEKKSQSGAIIEFNNLVDNKIYKVNINNINGGGAGKLFTTNGTADIRNIHIENVDVKLFNNQLFDTNVSIFNDFKCKVKLKVYGSLTFVNSNFDNSTIEIDVNNTGTISTNPNIDLNKCKLILKNSTRITDNIVTGNNTTWNLPQIPSSYALSQATWVQRCRVGDICKNSSPTIDEKGLLTGWVCTQIADTSLTRGVWKPTYVAIA